MARGRRAGLLAALELHLGGYVHVVAAAAGLSTLFHAVPSLYLFLKGISAAYLVFLGAKMIWQGVTARKDSGSPVLPSYKSGRRAFIESITVEVLNPKTALFFIAFSPQFVDPSATLPIWFQLLILGISVNIILASADLVYVYFAGAIVDKLRQSSRVTRVLERVGGTILIGLGFHLVFHPD